MKTEIICIGTEVLFGDIINTNASIISKICAKNGHYVYYSTVVGDNYNRAEEVINIAIKRSELIIICGGLGPTDDDITTEVVSNCIGRKLIYDEDRKSHILDFLNIESLDKYLLKQTYKIEGSISLSNPHGTAIGSLIDCKSYKIILLPGPPSECLPMLENEVIRRLKQYEDKHITSKTVKITNINEETSVKMLGDVLINQNDPTIAPYCKFMEVQYRITSFDINKINEVIEKFNGIFGQNIYGYDDITLEESIYNLLKKYNYKISLAESCTGGMVVSSLISVSGISEFLEESYITYASKSKENILGVKRDTIEKYFVVSEEVVSEMLVGLSKITKADCLIAISGVSGPNKNEYNQDVGYTVIGTKLPDKKATIIKYNFDGDREKNRFMACKASLIQLRNDILNLHNGYINQYSIRN